jgi:hypothetical protein
MPGCQTPQVFKEYFILRMEEGLGAENSTLAGRKEFYTRLEEREIRTRK